MSQYARPKMPGASVFFTVNLADRESDLLVREIEVLRQAVRVTRHERPFEIGAWVVLPNHMHCVWRLPDGDSDFSTRMAAIKARFTRTVRRPGFTPTLSPNNPYGVDAGRVRRGGAYEERVGVNPDLRPFIIMMLARFDIPHPTTPSNSRHSPLLMPEFSCVTTSPFSIRRTQSTALEDKVTPPIR